MTGRMVFALFVLALVVAFPALAGPIITNGSFEIPVVSGPGGFQTFVSGANMGGWTVSGGGVDLIDTYWNAADGAQSVDLNATTPGAISQTFLIALTAGQQYTLTFAMSANPALGQGSKGLRVDVGALSNNFSESTTTSSGPPFALLWHVETWTFIAPEGATAIQFSSLSDGACGPALDNVSLTTAPEPSTAVLFGTLIAALALFARRRRAA